jgi:hypothetical protein
MFSGRSLQRSGPHRGDHRPDLDCALVTDSTLTAEEGSIRDDALDLHHGGKGIAGVGRVAACSRSSPVDAG